MSWFGVEIDGPLVLTRGVHFAATAVVAGALLFRAVVADAVLRGEHQAGPVVALAGKQVRAVARIGLALTVVSGMTWVLLLTMSLSGESLGEAVMSGALRDVVNLTQFGMVSEIRLALAIVLAICLAFERSALWRRLALGAALCLMASIAWTGHAASTPHRLGYLHLAADVLHLTAAAAWVGGLVALALLLGIMRRGHAPVGPSLELDVARRFSSLGMVSVATLVMSGIVNAWILVGSFRGLVVTDYGWILLVKIAVFAIMVAFAAVNRFWLTPQLGEATAEPDALGRLARNTRIEIMLGLTVFAIVGVLGTLHPAIHLVK